MNKIAIQETTLSNARIVLADQVLEGAVCFADGVITDIGEASGRGQDLNGDYLIPGLVELHTDHLETHYAPRPKVRWHPVAAVQAHDAQIAASGIRRFSTPSAWGWMSIPIWARTSCESSLMPSRQG
jgi:alpha-D-ribose 1-methylphosphonate 5-triphosphate diphosphatase